MSVMGIVHGPGYTLVYGTMKPKGEKEMGVDWVEGLECYCNASKRDCNCVPKGRGQAREKEMGNPLLPSLSQEQERQAQDAEVWTASAKQPQITFEGYHEGTQESDRDAKKSQLVAMIVHELHLKEDQTGILLMKLLNYAELFDSKQHDYGPANISMFGEYGVLVRLNDKLQRLINLQKKADAPANESIEDTWRDIGGYGFIGEMLHAGEWAS